MGHALGVGHQVAHVPADDGVARRGGIVVGRPEAEALLALGACPLQILQCRQQQPHAVDGRLGFDVGPHLQLDVDGSVAGEADREPALDPVRVSVGRSCGGEDLRRAVASGRDRAGGDDTIGVAEQVDDLASDQFRPAVMAEQRAIPAATLRRWPSVGRRNADRPGAGRLILAVACRRLVPAARELDETRGAADPS